jgi:transcriptional regulator GlxA family with amidase domain
MWVVMTIILPSGGLGSHDTKCIFSAMGTSRRPRVLVIAFEGVQTLDVTGPAEVFAAAGRQEALAAYEIVVASTSGGLVRTSSGCGLSTRRLSSMTLRRTDTVIVAGGDDPAIRAAIADRALRRWLGEAARLARRVASVCSGAFILAAAGLLDGLTVATHWSGCDQLAAFRPALTVDRNAIFVRQGRFWTSAGVTTGIDMALAMVEEDRGRGLADGIASRLVLYARRPGFQSQFSDALVAQAEAGDPMAKVIGWTRAHLRDADIDAMARRAGMSVRTFHRRCLEVLATTPAKLVEKLRVEHARTLLSTSNVAAKDLAVSCGFGSPARMKRAFLRALGMTPRAYALLFGARLRLS